jgi:cytochrome c-type biogenesis protein CcmH
MMRRLILIVLLLLPLPAFAYDTSGALPDAAQEERARELFRELRCMVCQNQSIDDSDAPLAKDLRMLVRERIVAGDGNETIKAFLVERYGEFVLLKPRFGGGTLILWAAPAVVLLLGGALVFAASRRRSKQGIREELTVEERNKLDAILRRDA